VGQYTFRDHASLLFYSTWIIRYAHLFHLFLIQDALNISSSRTLDDRAIQNFVKRYVDDYVGVYNFVMPFLFCYHFTC